MSNAPTKPNPPTPSNLPAPAMWGRPVKAVYLHEAFAIFGKGSPVWRIILAKKDATSIGANEVMVKAMETHPGGVEVTMESGEKFMVPHARCTHLAYV